MRRQVITAAVLGLTLATTSLPALADNGDFSGHTDTDGPGYDVRTEVDYHHTTGGAGGGATTGAIMGAKPTVMVKVRLLMGVLAPMPKPN